MDFMGALSPPPPPPSAATARDVHPKQPPPTSTTAHDCSDQVHAAARALPPPHQQRACCVVDGHMPPANAAARLTLQVSGGDHDVASLDTSPRSTAVSETTAQLTIFYAGSMLVFENIRREKAEEIVFFAAKTTPDVGVGDIPVRHQQTHLQSAVHAYPNKRRRTSWDQAHEIDANGLFIHKNRTSACSQHLSSENEHGIIKETNPCSPQIQIGPRADVSLLVRNPSLVSFLERRKQRLASAAVAHPPREKSPDEKDNFPMASPRNKTPLGNMEQKWAFTNAENVNGNHDDETLDTELRI